MSVPAMIPQGVPGVDERRSLQIQAAGLAGVLAAGAVLAITSLRLPLLCPLRALTGIPCPLCGMTTGVVSTLRGDLVSAVRANLLAPAVVPGLVAALAHRVLRLFKALPARPQGTRSRRGLVAAAAGVLLSVSWIYELFRFNVL